MAKDRQYFGIFCAAALTFLGLGTAMSYLGDSFQQIPAYELLTSHQLEKAHQAREVETLLLGDSAMGNAIDAVQFGKLTNSRTLNLAFTETFGFASDYNVLKIVLKNNPVRRIVLMHTPHTFAQAFTLRGYFQTIERTRDASELASLDQAKLFDAMAEVFLSFRGRNVFDSLQRRLGHLPLVDEAEIQRHLTEHDYVPQGEPLRDVDAIHDRILATRIEEQQFFFLRKIFALCQNRGVTPVYLHSPLVAGTIAASADYLGQVNQRLRTIGFKVVDDILPLDQRTVGDELDHVAPAFKAEFTERYAALLGFQSRSN